MKRKTCSKNFYTVNSKGVELKEKSDKHRESSYKNTKRLVKKLFPKKPDFANQYVSDNTYFKKSNDAVMEFIPKGDTKKHLETYTVYANSSVSYKWNVFSNDYILVPEEPKFKYLHTNRKREINTGSYRDEDTEAKLLEHIAAIIDENDSAIINLYTRLEPCLSCDNVIIQFMSKFKKIEINIYFEEPYLPIK